MKQVIYRPGNRCRLQYAAFTWYVSVLSCTACFWCVAHAKADLTVAGRIAVVRTSPDYGSDDNPANVNRTVTVYSRGKQARTEVDGLLTTIFDNGSVFQFDNQAKTYYKKSMKSWLAQDQSMVAHAVPTSFLNRLDVDTQLNFDKAGDDAQQTLNGFFSQKYLLSGWINLSTPTPDTAPDNGYGGGGDGDHGGNGHGMSMDYVRDKKSNGLLHTVQFGGTPAASQPTGVIIPTTVSGEVWLTKSVSFPQDKSNTVWAQAMVASWGVGQLAPGLASKIAGERALPTQATINFAWNKPQQASYDEDSDSPGSGIAAGRPISVTTTVHVTSVSETPVDATLFAVPTGFSQVPAPVPLPRSSPEAAPDQNNNRHNPAANGLDDPNTDQH